MLNTVRDSDLGFKSAKLKVPTRNSELAFTNTRYTKASPMNLSIDQPVNRKTWVDSEMRRTQLYKTID